VRGYQPRRGSRDYGHDFLCGSRGRRRVKASRTRPANVYERVVSVLAVAVAVTMVLSGVYVAGVALTFVVVMGRFGSNK
jgi:hypothetical protein